MYTDFAYGGVVADIIFVCILSHCVVVAGNKNLLRFFPIPWLQKTTH